MKISKEQVQYVARLARLELDQDQLESFSRQLATILDYMETLSQVDTSGVEPTAHVIALTNAFRQDQVDPHLERSRALANAPASEEGSFVVPKVI